MAIFYMILSALLIAILGLLAKLDQSAMPLSLAVFLRLLVPVLLLLPFMKLNEIKRSLFHANRIQWLRAGFAFAAQYCLFAYIMHASLLNAILLYNTGPLFIPLLSALIYHEKISQRAILSVMLGFIGIALVLHPHATDFNRYSLLGLASGFFMACSQVCFHKASHTETVNYNMFSVYALSSCFAIVPMLFGNTSSLSLLLHLNLLTLLALLGMALASLGNQVFRYLAYKRTATPAHLAPFMYLAVLISGIIDWLGFHDTPTLLSSFGAILVLIATLIIAFKKNITLTKINRSTL